MRGRRHYWLIGLLVISTALIYISAKKRDEKVLGLISPLVEITPMVIPSVSPSAEPQATPSAIVTIKPTPTPTKKPVPTPTMTPFEVVYGFIERFAVQYGVDPNVIRYIAICESDFESNAKNGSYIGLFQFGTVTWINLRKEMGEDSSPNLRYSAEESVQTAAYALLKGKGKIWPNCMP